MNRRSATKGIAAACGGALLAAGGKAWSRELPKRVTESNPPEQTEAPTSAGLRIATNQCGYLPNAAKVASVALPMDARDGQEWFVLAAQDEVALRGTMSDARVDDASGDRIATADFSALRAPGTYRLRVAETISDPVLIAEGVYQAPMRLAMRAFYGQRCGCKVDLGGGYKHKACHKVGEFHSSAGRSGSVRNSGGWHDAGDYGRYVVNSGITTATLLWTWEMFPQAVRSLKLGIPQSGGRVPDFLAEVRWNLQWMLSMQDPADGGVWHKQTSAAFCGFIMPDRDILPSEVIGTGSAPFKSTCATADLAAVAAIAARCYQPYDAKFADACLAAARKAYAWARANPDVMFRNPPGVTTGEYGDKSGADELLWAAAELFRTTGEAEFRQAFEAGVPTDVRVTTPGWNNMESFALWTYAMSGQPSVTPGVRDRIVAATNGAAADLLERARKNGYGNTLRESDYVWGSSSVAANDALLLLVAERLQPNAAAREAAMANLHYLLGRNCFAVSWVTQVGVRPFQHPHHRPSEADKIAAPWPGLLSGGPNAHGGDPVADKLPKRPPMRMWVDDWQAYSMNEVAINWNAPLVFLLAAANG